jgi:hypothetical protein
VNPEQKKPAERATAGGHEIESSTMKYVSNHPLDVNKILATATAFALAERGRAVFPMNFSTKRPACPHGIKDATRDLEIIRKWFIRPGLVPAVATGEPSGVVVLDIDRQHGGSGWWSMYRDRLPETEVYRTKSGGLHAVFQNAPGIRTITLGTLGDGVELRAGGASAIYWPSVGLPTLCDAPPAAWPEWLMPPPRPAWTPPPAPAWAGDDRKARAYALAALRRGIERVATAGNGTRNAALNAEAYSLIRLTDGGALDHAEIAEALAHAALAAGLDRREIEQTLRSALSARGGR